jgi:chromosome segregation ATPase
MKPDPFDWNNPETIRFLAKDRATTLTNARRQYSAELEEAHEQYIDAKAAFEAAAATLAEVRAKLRGLAEQIAHYEAIAAEESPTPEMFFRGRDVDGNSGPGEKP